MFVSVHAEATVELSKADSGKELSCRSEGGMVIATVLAVVGEWSSTVTTQYRDQMTCRHAGRQADIPAHRQVGRSGDRLGHLTELSIPSVVLGDLPN